MRIAHVRSVNRDPSNWPRSLPAVDYAVVCLVALLASALTLVSGFGLGTLLLPAFALFFSLPAAIAATAIVHLANNLFSLGLVGKYADRRLLLAFGVPAVLGALLGALALRSLDTIPAVTSWSLAGHRFEITPVKLVVAVLILGFALLDLTPGLSRLKFGARMLPLGGGLSGFFGGLSGHQGTLRSAFLMRAGISKETYVGMNCVCGVMVDVARLCVYGIGFYGAHLASAKEGGARFGLIAAACVAAFLGSFVGSRVMKKMTLETVRRLVGVLLVVSALALGTGLI